MAFISEETFVSEDLTRLQGILSHLYGPNSHCVVINNKTVTSSHQLFESFTPKSDVLNLMIGYLRQQAEFYKDGGLFVGLLAINVIQRFKKIETALPTIMEANDTFMSWFKKETTSLTYQLNIGKLSHVMSVIRPILLSKMTLAMDDCRHLSILFARVFTMHNPWDDCHVLQIQYNGVSDCSIEDGLMLRLDRYFHTNVNRPHQSKVLLFSVSIALDSEEILADTKMNIEVESSSQFKSNLLRSRVLNICNEISSLVDILICQKVVHPIAKKLFFDQGIICIDRVGGKSMPLLERICNCKLVSSLTERNLIAFIGKVSKMNSIVIKDKHFIKINASDVKTLILTAKDERYLNALYSCYEKSLIALRTIASNPRVLCGGGCTETQLAVKLLLQRPDVSYSNIFVTSLLKIAQEISKRPVFDHKVDLNYHHHWISNSQVCCCGKIESNSSIKYLSFIELFNPNNTQFSLPDIQTRRKLDSDKSEIPGIVQSETIFSYNISSAVQLANMVLRIGSRIGPGS